MRQIFSLLSIFAFSVSVYADQCLRLPSPNLSRECCKGYRVAVYGESKNGPKLSVEALGDKKIIHNYGHACEGVSISWGSAKWVSSHIEGEQHAPVAIIGAGINGLTLANVLLDKGYPVIVYASCFPPDTMSNVAPIIWKPVETKGGSKDVDFSLMNRNTYAMFYELANCAVPEYRGVSATTVFTVGATRDYICKLPKGEKVTVSFDTETHCNVIRWCTFKVDPDIYICDLYNKAKQKGACFQQRTFTSKDDVMYLKEPIVVNCAGVGSKQIFNDVNLTPVQTQIMNFQPQSSIDYVVEVYKGPKLNFYVIPVSSRLVLGQTENVGSQRCVVDKKAGRELWQEAQSFFRCP